MKVTDELYGTFNVDNDMLVALLQSDAVNRLRSISQAGASSLVRDGRSVNRYEHSVGVMLLARKLGAGFDEQAAGLLQDISHTAFSHTADYVFGDRREEYHEKIVKEVVNNSDLPEILGKFGRTFGELFESDKNRVIDAPAPNLCADRIDYTLRDLFRFECISLEEVSAFTECLRFVDGNVAVSDVTHARKFANWYHTLVNDLFMNPLELWAHENLSSIIRDAIKTGVMSEADLLKTDVEVERQICTDSQLSQRFRHLRQFTVEQLPTLAESKRVFSKPRTIDPLVVSDDGLKTLSSLDPAFSDLWSDILIKATDGVLVGRS